MSVTYNLTAIEIVEAAFNTLGIAQEGEALTDRMAADGMRALNLLVKTWGAQEHLWTLTEGTVALVADTAAYAISPKPMRVLSVRRRQSGIDTPLGMFSRTEYFDQPNKTASPSTPVNFYYDPQASTGTLYLWPAPSSSAASQFTIHMTYLRRMNDLVTNADNLDMPQEWLEAVVYNLAVRLMPQYPVNDPNQGKLIVGMAADLYAGLQGWDNEPASVFLKPDFEGMRA
jgi:hypothetical protein